MDATISMTYKEFFKDKKIAVVGLGPRFEMTADVKFLVKSGMDVALYDMRSESSCSHALAELVEAGLTKYAFGVAGVVRTATTASNAKTVKADEKLADDLALADLIILSPDISDSASFLAKARTAKIPIEYPQTLFLKLSPPVTLIGVVGACGKTTVAHMIYAILKKAFEEYEDQGIYYIDPEAPSALAHLKKIRKGDLVIARITETLIPAFEYARVSPHIAVFTGLSSQRSSVRADVSANIFNILEFQTYNNFIIGSDVVIDEIRENPIIKPTAKMLRTGAGIVPADWHVRYRGLHDRDNAALALRTAELFKVPLETSRTVLEAWKGLKGRLELVKKVAGIEFYNDSAADAPTATLTALRAISENKNVVLIMGGALTDTAPGTTAQGSYAELIENIPQYVSSVILIPGSGTVSIRRNISAMAGQSGLPHHYAHDIEDAVKIAREKSGKGSRVLFSPAFEARGTEKSRAERGEKFVKAVREL